MEKNVEKIVPRGKGVRHDEHRSPEDSHEPVPREPTERKRVRETLGHFGCG